MKDSQRDIGNNHSIEPFEHVNVFPLASNGGAFPASHVIFSPMRISTGAHTSGKQTLNHLETETLSIQVVQCLNVEPFAVGNHDSQCMLV